MTLARKLTLRIGALVVAVVLIAAASLIGLLRLERRVDVAELTYQKLRLVFEIGHHAATAKTLVDAGAEESQVARSIDAGRRSIANLAPLLEGDAFASPGSLASLASAWTAAGSSPGAARYAALNRALNEVAILAGAIRAEADADRAHADAQLNATLTLVAALSAVTLAAAIAVGVMTYRGVMRPLRALDAAMARVAQATFSDRIDTGREREFANLAARFNDMADRLDTLYRTLEDRVNAQSRALVRSERLAGVGQLAAGLAHEINNPLGIIGGYAEAAIAAGDDRARIDKALRVIADEAFRCKQITAKLLALARPVDAEPAPLDLRPIVERAAEMMGDLPQFARRTVRTRADDRPCTVRGHEGELTQVLVNLLANGLDAVDDERGEVTVALSRRGPWVVLRVSDNGRGIGADRLARVFEPFYTDAPQRDRPGTGLGLAVTHAIVTQHGGRITAESPGEGRGATFTVELPAWPGDA